jgi:site-specific recombinase XerD
MSTSIKFKFKPSRIEGKEGIICVQLIHNRRAKLLRTRFHLFPAEWDRRRNTVITAAGKTPAERQVHLLSIQAGLEATAKQLREHIRLLERKGDYTVEELAGVYARNSFSGYFFAFADFTVQHLKNTNRRKTATLLQSVKTSFEHFLGGRDMLIDRIDGDLMRDYQTWLKSAGLTKNSVACYMRVLRSLYNQAVGKHLTIQKNPFTRIVTAIDKTVKRAISEEDLMRLKNTNLSPFPNLALTRDLFMFSFYMRGISFVDMANLLKSNLKNGYIHYARSKTSQTLTIKIEPCMQQIIDRHQTHTIDNYLLPIYTARSRDSNSQLRKYNKRLRRIAAILVLQQPLSSYVSRHTWATLALRKGIPVEVISESMGHENETTTRIYLASLNQNVIDKANGKIIGLK